MPDDFDRMWADLGPVGRSATSGGYYRQPFASAERECHAWFVEQCRARDLRIEHDGNGNTVGWWEPADGVESSEGIVRHDRTADSDISASVRAGLSAAAATSRPPGRVAPEG